MTSRRVDLPLLVQARTGSTRLPGKVLAEIGGKPLLAWLLDRLGTSRLCSEIVVVTTTAPADDAVAALATRHGASVFRGHPTDVLARYAAAAAARGDAAVVRINGDSPLIDGRIVDLVLEEYLRGDADLVENNSRSGWPVGTSIEAMSLSCLRRLDRLATEPRHREHVTLYAYDHPSRFSIRYVAPPADLAAPDLHLYVDTAEELERIRAICDHFSPRQDFGVDEVIAALSHTAQT
jgi:spore coat polysaccharide biosynthesis protein SpsF (cytidylyltransferase family)